jgi:hypothetical protein
VSELARSPLDTATTPPVAWHGPAGAPLYADTTVTPNSGTLHDGERRWPVVEGIPWLRAGRDDVRERAVAALDAGDPEAAAVVLLADADDWWDAPPPPDAQLRAALRSTTLRVAVELLGFGRVGTYFLHRWSDPSWLAALALTAAHPPAGRAVVDLACGAGHLLRHLALHGHRDLTGVDVVFAKAVAGPAVRAAGRGVYRAGLRRPHRPVAAARARWADRYWAPPRRLPRRPVLPAREGGVRRGGAPARR